MATIDDCKIINLPKEEDPRGSLTYIYQNVQVPFEIRRVFYIYDVPAGKDRGAHAHKELEQLIVAASGSFTVTLDDGKCKRSFFLNHPYQGLYVKPGLWRDLADFSSGAVAMILASKIYQKSDYIRDYQDFIHFRNE